MSVVDECVKEFDRLLEERIRLVLDSAAKEARMSENSKAPFGLPCNVCVTQDYCRGCGECVQRDAWPQEPMVSLHAIYCDCERCTEIRSSR